MDLKWPEMPSKVNFGHPKWQFDQKWLEMQSKVIFGHPKWPPKKKNVINLKWPKLLYYTIESEFQTSKMADRSEMARNAIKSDFRTSKMSAGGHFVKKIKKNGQKCDRKWISDIQNGRHQPFCKKIKKKVLYWSEMVRNATESDFWNPKWPAAAILYKNFTKIKLVVLIWNGKKCDTKWFLAILKKIIYKKSCARYIFTFGQYIYTVHTDSYVGNEGIYIVFALWGECTQF